MGFNKQLASLIREANCGLFVGDRGVGKSSLMALACRDALKIGRPVYCQFPYKGAYQIPMVEKVISLKPYGDIKFSVVDKSWLYSADLRGSVVMVDEARTVWNARDFKNWNENDENFFNYLRKNDITLLLSTQRNDGLDLNIRCAADYTFFIQRTKYFKHWSTVDTSRSVQVKVADKNSLVVSRGYSKNAMRVSWEICELPIAFSYFYRKPYYGDFETLYVTDVKNKVEPILWDNILDALSKPDVILKPAF